MMRRGSVWYTITVRADKTGISRHAISLEIENLLRGYEKQLTKSLHVSSFFW